MQVSTPNSGSEIFSWTQMGDSPCCLIPPLRTTTLTCFRETRHRVVARWESNSGCLRFPRFNQVQASMKTNDRRQSCLMLAVLICAESHRDLLMNSITNSSIDLLLGLWSDGDPSKSPCPRRILSTIVQCLSSRLVVTSASYETRSHPTTGFEYLL